MGVRSCLESTKALDQAVLERTHAFIERKESSGKEYRPSMIRPVIATVTAPFSPLTGFNTISLMAYTVLTATDFMRHIDSRSNGAFGRFSERLRLPIYLAGGAVIAEGVGRMIYGMLTDSMEVAMGLIGVVGGEGHLTLGRSMYLKDAKEYKSLAEG